VLCIWGRQQCVTWYFPVHAATCCIDSFNSNVKLHCKTFDTHGRICIHMFLQVPHRKKSSGMRSGNLGGHAVGPPCPIHISWHIMFNLYPTKDPYAGLLNSSAYPTKYPDPGLRALRCCCVSFSETHCTIPATFLYMPVWWDVLWFRNVPALFNTS
jgi:hypothetical protein